jgi:hypothetical protein
MKHFLFLLIVLTFLSYLGDGGHICSDKLGARQGPEQAVSVSHQLPQRNHAAFQGQVHSLIVRAPAHFADIPHPAPNRAKMVGAPHLLKIIKYWHLGSSVGLP